jgi:hypothetical protein
MSTASAFPDPSEKTAAGTLARECGNFSEVVLWCANRVRSVDDDPAVQDAADHLHDLAVRARADTPVTDSHEPDRPSIIRWCAQDIHSMGGNYAVERAAQYLDDLATEAKDADQAECGWNPIDMTPNCDFDSECPTHGRTEGER